MTSARGILQRFVQLTRLGVYCASLPPPIRHPGEFGQRVPPSGDNTLAFCNTLKKEDTRGCTVP